MFVPGQRVLCINDNPYAFTHLGINPTPNSPWEIKNGQIYTVSHLNIGPKTNTVYVWLTHLTDKKGWGYYHERFRPLDDDSMEIFKKMCKKSLADNMKEMTDDDLKKLGEEIAEEVKELEEVEDLNSEK